MKNVRGLQGLTIILIALCMSPANAAPVHHVKLHKDEFALPLAKYLIAKYNGGAHPELCFIDNKTQFQTLVLLSRLQAAGISAETASRAHKTYLRSRRSTLFEGVFADRVTGKKGIRIDLGPAKSRGARSVVVEFRVLYGSQGGYGGQCLVQKLNETWIVKNEKITRQY